MGKILESLPSTIVAGIVITIVVALVAPYIAGQGKTPLPSELNMPNN